MAREPQTADAVPSPAPARPRSPSRLDQLEAMLLDPAGASLAELAAATGWQPHSVRGALAGALKKRGLVITSERSEGTRRYHAVRPE